MLAVGAVGARALRNEGGPGYRHVFYFDSAKARALEIAVESVQPRKIAAVHLGGEGFALFGGECSALEEVLDVHASAGAERLEAATVEAVAVRNVQEHEPAEQRIEMFGRHRAFQNVALPVRHEMPEAATPRQLPCDLVHVGLKLQRCDGASRSGGDVSGGAAQPGADLQHAVMRLEREPCDALVDGVRTVVVVLIESAQHLEGDRIVVADSGIAELGEHPALPASRTSSP